MYKNQSWSEQKLVLELYAKNPSAMEYLYNLYHKKIYAFILYIIKDTDESQDIMQDVFVKFWINIEKYDSTKSGLYTWMINCTRNHCLDRLKSKSTLNNNQNINLEIVSSKENINYTQTTEDIGLTNSLNKLSIDSAQLIDLIYYKGYTQSEASKYLNIPLGTIKTNIRKAIIDLRKIIS